MSFTALARQEPRALAFGFLCTLASSPGQTFGIALFLPGIKASFGLGDAEVANLYAAATILSAAVLWRAGRWIDRHDLLAYALASGSLLLLACLLVVAAGPLALLSLGLFALRLSGQGLLTHVAATATGRYFTQARGKALSLTSLGFSAGEALMPPAVVMAVALWGWRPALLSVGALAMLVVVLAVGMVWRKGDFRSPRAPAAGGEDRKEAPSLPERPADRTRYLLLTSPLFVAQPLVVTALVFHQAVIADEKGLSLQAFAVSFSAFAVAKVSSGLLVGPAIDRFGARGLFALHLLPLCLAVVVLLPAAGAWSLPPYWLLVGTTSGMSATLQMAILAEVFPPHRLGAARSVFASIAIFASALGPAIYGALLALGFSLAAILIGTLVAMLGATTLGMLAQPYPDK